MKKFMKRFSASVMTGLMVATSGSAFAQTDNNFNEIGGNIIDSISSLPGLISAVSYMVGLLLGALGVLKIKDHVENPGNEPLKNGAIHLAAGGALFALPMVFEAMLNTIGDDATAPDAATLQAIDDISDLAQ